MEEPRSLKKPEIEMEELPPNVMVLVERDPAKIPRGCESTVMKGVVTEVEAIYEGSLSKDHFLHFCEEPNSKPVRLRISAFIDNEDLLSFLTNTLHPPMRKTDLRGENTPAITKRDPPVPRRAYDFSDPKNLQGPYRSITMERPLTTKAIARSPRGRFTP